MGAFILNIHTCNKTMSWKRKTAIGLVAAFGVLNLGALIGHLGNKPQKPQVEIIYPPTGEYTSYTVTVNEDGSYTIDYRAHDPSLTTSETYTDSSNGAFGVGGRSTTTITRENIATVGGVVTDEGKLTAEQIECIKAVGGGESNGALVGGSIATGMAPLVSGIPYVGWLATGWLVMFGQDLGSDVGGQVASSIKGC